MKNEHVGILKRTAALIMALLMILAVVPAATAAEDWSQLVITLSWPDAAGTMSAQAVPQMTTG